jgi:molecular chaperone DnaK
VFTTVADNQTSVDVHVLQGESDMVIYNKSLQRFELTNIPPAPKWQPQIEVGFEIDVNGILSVEATDQATGRRQAITIHSSGGLSAADIHRLVVDTRRRENVEKTKKEREGIVRQLDGLVANTMCNVQALEGKLKPDEADRVLGAIARARRSRVDARLDELKSRLSEMNQAANIIGQAMLRP